MKKLLAFLILLVLITDASAQKPWKWTRLQGPNVASSNNPMLFGANQDIIVQDTLGYYSSVNNGTTWDYHAVVSGYKAPITGSYAPYSSMVIGSSGEYYFVFASARDDAGNNPVEGIYKSSDFGITWKMIANIQGIYQLFAGINNSVLLLSNPTNTSNGNGVLWESIDNGSSWTQLLTLGGYYYYNVSIVASTTNGIFILANGQITKFSPSDQKLLDFSNGLKSGNCSLNLTTLSNGTLLASSCNSIYSSDGVNPWDSISNYYMYGLLTGNGDTVVGLNSISSSGQYYIVMSTDKGKSWDSIADFHAIRNSDYGFNFNYNDPNRLLFEDYRGIYISTDRGGMWKEIGLPYATVSNVIVSGDGIFTRVPIDQYQSGFSTSVSEDKGVNWEMKNPYYSMYQIGKGIGENVVGIATDSLSHDYAWIFDTNNYLWKKQSLVEDLFEYYSTSPVFIASDNENYIYVSRGSVIYRSNDNAFSWINVNAPDDATGIYSLDASSDGSLYFGTYPIMYRSEDHGTTWVKLEPIHDIIKLSYIKTFGTDGVLLGTEGDGLLISNDKGNTWLRLDGNNFDTVTCIAIDSKGEIAAGTNRGLWLLDSARHSWSKVKLGQDDNLYIGGIDVAANDDFYVGTYGSSVWMGTRNYSSVEYAALENPTMRIIPNPTSGKITIDLPTEEQAKLELYDILGRKVAVLANGILSEQISFNTSTLPNGIYTLMLTGVKNETAKLVVSH